MHILSDFEKEKIKLYDALFQNNMLCLIGKEGRLMVYDLIFSKTK